MGSTCSSGSNPSRTARARVRKNPTDSCSTRGGTGYSRSAARRRTSRLVTSKRRPRQEASSSASTGAASVTCSKLSSTSSMRQALTCSASLPASPSAEAIAASTRSGSRTSWSGTHQTPCSWSSTTSAAAWTAIRVFPEPPAPVSVRSRTSGSRSSEITSPSSFSRPTKAPGHRGRRRRSARRGGRRGLRTPPG